MTKRHLWNSIARSHMYTCSSRRPGDRDGNFSSNFYCGFDTKISILDMGVKFSYQVPSFSVFHVDLRQIKLQVTAVDGSVLLYDGFIRADLSLEDRETPYSVKLKDILFCTGK